MKMQINYDRITLYDIWIKEREDENERLKTISFSALYPIYFAVVLHGLIPTNENEIRVYKMSSFVKTFRSSRRRTLINIRKLCC